MRTAGALIAENNEKREALTKENLKMYEDLMLYVRTDLRVDEQAGEEVLMDLLDHLLEAQEHGRKAEEVFSNEPQKFADEIIEQLPSEKKRNVALFVSSQLAGMAGWFTLTYGVLQLIMGAFMDNPPEITLGTIAFILLVAALCTVAGVSVLFKIIRSASFQPKEKARSQYWKAGLLGAGLFAVILGASFLIPEWGPVVNLPWWGFILTAFVLFVLSKVLGNWAN